MKADPTAVLWVPDPNLLALEGTSCASDTADVILNSLEDFVPEQWGLPPYDP